MHKQDNLFLYIGFAAIGLLIIGLIGWYFFISGRTADVSATDTARGFNIGVPSFAGSRGSTAENIAAGFGETSEAETTEEGEVKRPPRLWRVNAAPVAGAGFIEVGSTTILRYVERSTGHIFDVNPLSGEVKRLTNQLIPKVYEASVGNSAIVARSIREDGKRETFVGVIGTTTEEGFYPLTGTDLGPDIRDIVLDGDGVLFLGNAADGGIRLVRAAIDGSKPVVIQSLGAGDFNLSLLADNRIVLVERAASGIMGHAYEVENGLRALTRATPGLTLLARANSTAILVGSDTGTALSLSAQPATETTTVPLALQTTAEKCVWMPGISLTAYCSVPQESPPNNFLTSWHRGTIHTIDSWHLIDVGAGTSESFFEMSADDAIDVEQPITDPGGNFIAFLNARDKSLWLLRIIE